MAEGDALWQATRLTLRPTGSGRSYSVAVEDATGATLATCDAGGTIRDAAGDVIATAPVQWEGRGDRPTDASVEIGSADGNPLGKARVTKYGVGPRAKKATIDVTDAQGAEVLRLEPRDGRGSQLVVVSGDADLATVAVEQVKAGFLRKARVYTVEPASGLTDAMRPLVLLTAIRYDALLNAVVSAAAADRD